MNDPGGHGTASMVGIAVVAADRIIRVIGWPIGAPSPASVNGGWRSANGTGQDRYVVGAITRVTQAVAMEKACNRNTCLIQLWHADCGKMGFIGKIL
jgi:hypothetical protein